MTTISIALKLIDDIDNRLLQHARNAADCKIIFKLDILGNFRLKLARHRIQLLLSGNNRKNLIEIIKTIAHVNPKMNI